MNGSLFFVLGLVMMALALLAFIVMFLIQRYTAYGRIVIACGSNPTAVKLAGINVQLFVMSCYIISGLLSSLVLTPPVLRVHHQYSLDFAQSTLAVHSA